MSEEKSMPAIRVTDDCNYIAAFLTMACPYRCPYCINEYNSQRKAPKIMPGADWVRGLNRLVHLERQTGVVPVTLQGGEPSCHPDFYDIINGVAERIRLDILTNLSFDVEEMIRRVDPQRLRRPAPYASIRVSYHPGQSDLETLLHKTHRMIEAGFAIGVYGVMHPAQAQHILAVQERALAEGIDFRTKEFLGYAEGKLFGQYKYSDACTMTGKRVVRCKTSELLIAADGGIHQCHYFLYEQKQSIGHLLDPAFAMRGMYHPCDCYGYCNPCDIKVKTNRLQQFGHTSVDILFPDAENFVCPALRRLEQGAQA